MTTTRRARVPCTPPANRAATKPRAFRPPLVLRAFTPGAPPARSAARRTRDTNRLPDPLPRALGGPGRGTNRSSSSRFTGITPERQSALQRRRHAESPASTGSCQQMRHVAGAATCRRNPCADNLHDARTCRRLLSCLPCHFRRSKISPLVCRLYSARNRLHMAHRQRAFSKPRRSCGCCLRD